MSYLSLSIYWVTFITKRVAQRNEPKIPQGRHTTRPNQWDFTPRKLSLDSEDQDNIKEKVKLWLTFKTAMTRQVLDGIWVKELHIFTRLKTPQITLDSELDGARSSTPMDTLALLESPLEGTSARRLWALPSELCSTQTRVCDQPVAWASVQQPKSFQHELSWTMKKWSVRHQDGHLCVRILTKCNIKQSSLMNRLVQRKIGSKQIVTLNIPTSTYILNNNSQLKTVLFYFFIQCSLKLHFGHSLFISAVVPWPEISQLRSFLHWVLIYVYDCTEFILIIGYFIIIIQYKRQTIYSIHKTLHYNAINLQSIILSFIVFNSNFNRNGVVF